MFFQKNKKHCLHSFQKLQELHSDTFGKLNNADLEFPSIKDEDGNEVQLNTWTIIHAS